LAHLSELDCLDARGPEFVRDRILELAAQFGASSAEELADAVESLMKACDAPTRLAEVGARDTEAHATLVARVHPQRLANHPQRLAATDLEQVVAAIA
ncbi:MAG: hypothetical protein ACO4CZ_09580, partial [Planctomycetota bacterium]